MNKTQELIGKKIKFLRENLLQLSQKDFALKVNLDPTYISRVESGKQNLTIETLELFCHAFEMNLKQFFEFELKE